MCGIVGFIGEENAAPILLDGLSKLEYRGYDSAGVAVFHNDKIEVAKTKGRLQALSDMIDGGNKIEGTLGIGHTRWATHGQPSDINSHPHTSQSGDIAVVHNGIIENYLALKNELMAEGIRFVSETDTEVIAHLVSKYYQGDLLAAVTKVLSLLEGSYALGVICEQEPERMIAVRKESPLIVGVSESGNFIASDVPAILAYTRDVYYLENKELVELTRNGVRFFDVEMHEIQKELVHVNWDVSAAEKGGFDHFMMKEIFEQPCALRDTISPRVNDGRIKLDDIKLDEAYLKNIDRIYIVACGSAYHVGMVGKYLFEQNTRIPTEACLASEFRYASPIVDEKSLVIIISQSGETADTLAAMREAKRLGARTLAIVNVVGSSIAKDADDVIYTWAGPEISVATTKAYSTQLAVIYLLVLDMAQKLGKLSDAQVRDALAELETIPDKIEDILAQKEVLEQFARQYYQCNDIFFIGRNLDYALCLEGSLKLKEISYIHSEAYAAGELKHGTISLIETGTLVIALASYEQLFDKIMSNVKEVKARGAIVLGFTEGDRQVDDQAVDGVFRIPKTAQMFMPSLEVIPLQLFAYYVARERGCDIDKPRNLAKSVTVE